MLEAGATSIGRAQRATEQPATAPSPRPSLARDALWIATVAIVYFAAARFGLSLSVKPEGIAPVWLPEGVFLPGILLTRPARRPALVTVLLLTDFACEMLAGTPLLVSGLYALALTGDAVLGAWLLRRFVGEQIAFRRSREVLAFVGLVVVLTNGLAALVAAGASLLVSGTSFWNSALWWFASDGVGNLMLTPLVLSWAPVVKAKRAWSSRRTSEGAVLLATLAAVNFFVIRSMPSSVAPLLFLPGLTVPFLLWAALRFSMPGVSAALAVVAAIVVGFAVSTELPGASLSGSLFRDVIVLQLYLVATAIPSLFLGAVVSEREEVVAALRLREALLGKAEEMAGVGSWQLDLVTGVLTWSDEVYRIFGTTPGAFGATYEAFMEAIHPDDRAAVGAAYSNSIREGKDSYEIEHRVVRRSTGEIRHVHEKCEHVRDGAGVVVRSVGMVHDVTERRRVERALVERNRYIDTVLENSPIGFAVNTIHDGKGVFVGGKFEDIYGVARGSLGSVDDYFEKVYLDPAFREQIRARILGDMATGDAARMCWEDIPITTAAGESKFVTAVNIPLLDQGLMVSTVQDVTARHRAEVALRESEERFRAVIEQAGDGFELTDAEGRFVDVNGATCRQLGYTKEELLRLSVPDVDPNLNREEYAARFQAFTGKPSTTFETLHRRKDGTTFPVEATVSIVRIGETLRGLVLVRDISDRKREMSEMERLQAQLVQAQKMESIGRLAGGVAHDFNNMLGAIVGNVEFALAALPEGSAVREDLEEILAAAHRSADLTRQLLAFARRQTISPRRLDLNDAVTGTVKMLRRLIGEDIDLAWLPGANLWPVKMDPTQIDQILANLGVNARDAISGVGKVTIETENAVFDPDTCADHPGVLPGDYVMLAVSDDGAGMTKEVQDHVFEPFFTTKDLGRGTGLGLATVYGIVRQNDGFISVYSEPGRGASFKIYLPRLADGSAEAPAERPETAQRGGTETVLLVEDERMILNLGARILGSLGYRVLAADSPSYALVLASRFEGPIHLLVTDVVMPEMSGKALAEQLAARRPETRILYTSGYTADSIAHHGVLEEGIEFLQKPFSAHSLGAKVREVLDRPRR